MNTTGSNEYAGKHRDNSFKAIARGIDADVYNLYGIARMGGLYAGKHREDVTR